MLDAGLELVWKHGNWGKYERDLGEGKGFKYMWEKSKIKLSTLFTFFRMAPKENLIMLFYDMPKRGLRTIMKKQKS